MQNFALPIAQQQIANSQRENQIQSRDFKGIKIHVIGSLREYQVPRIAGGVKKKEATQLLERVQFSHNQFGEWNFLCYFRSKKKIKEDRV